MNQTDSIVDFEFIYETNPDMCLSLETKTGRIVSCNKTLTDTLGYTKEEVLSFTLFDLYHASQVELVQANLKSIANDEKPEHSEFVICKKNGETIEVTLKLSFVKDESGKVLYSNAVWRDISELKRTQRALEKEKKRLKRKMP